MVEVYCKLIIAGRRAFDRVPDLFKEQVKERLRELGYNPDGSIITAEE
ncbi:MAG: CD1375 family protein [Eubacteriales bacterium]|nr:CD1375 family protein [Eubacteriales bacterium]